MKRVLFLLILVLPTRTYAGDRENQGRETGLTSPRLGPPLSYCGMYSLCLAARSLGRDVLFSELLKPEYISSQRGSSLDDLICAANELRLKTKPIAGMSTEVLSCVRCPLILHVKYDVASTKDYNHWVLFMGVENGKARIYDGVYPLESVELADLAARWDGVGLLISDAPLPVNTLRFVVIALFIFYAGASVGAIALFLWLQQRVISILSWASWSRGWHHSVLELAMLLMVAFVLGVGFQFVHAGGFLSHSPSVAAIQDMHLGGFLPKAKVADVPELLCSEGLTIVDARLPQDFAAGHIANAINIPPNSLPEQCQESLVKVPTSNRILLYCQSNGCPYSEIVARKLIALGYSNIVHFRDGWIAWEKYQQKAEP